MLNAEDNLAKTLRLKVLQKEARAAACIILFVVVR